MKIREANIKAKNAILDNLDNLFSIWTELEERNLRRSETKEYIGQDLSQEEINLIRKQMAKRIKSIYHLLGYTTGIGG
jgi:Holliday junction resolvasome RuvABC ATP-dependent DNA helicase subunit|tara:strand:+ start:644 stop:877 length:234 start_codon:yes stop_codon:yes gene_type:complete